MNRFAITRRAALAAAGALALPGQARAATPPTAFIVADAATERYSQKWALSCEMAALHTALQDDFQRLNLSTCARPVGPS